MRGLRALLRSARVTDFLSAIDMFSTVFSLNKIQNLKWPKKAKSAKTVKTTYVAHPHMN
jgi:hypothetical protein